MGAPGLRTLGPDDLIKSHLSSTPQGEICFTLKSGNSKSIIPRTSSRTALRADHGIYEARFYRVRTYKKDLSGHAEESRIGFPATRTDNKMNVLIFVLESAPARYFGSVFR